MRPASKKEPAKEKRDLDTDDEDLSLSFGSSKTATSCTSAIKERTSSVAGPSCYTGTQGTKRLARASRRDLDFEKKKTESKALRDIVSKLSEERILKDLRLKQHHMSSAQIKKRTTHLDIPGIFLTLTTRGEDMTVLQFR